MGSREIIGVASQRAAAPPRAVLDQPGERWVR